MTLGSAARARVALRPFVADGLLALALSLAAATAAASAESPLHWFLSAFAGLAVLTLALRRVYPVAVLVVTVAVTSFFAVVYDGYWPFAALVAFYSVAAHTERRKALAAGIAGLLALAWPIASNIRWHPLTWHNLALEAGRLAPLAAAWVLGDNMRTRRAYLRAVEDRATQLEREQQANALRAAAEEQARIAREVHDVVAHNLSVIIVQATAADAVFASDPVDAQRAVRTIGRTAREALDELRRVLGIVRPGDEAELSPQPELARLPDLVEQVQTAGLGVTLEINGEQRQLPPALELSAYRIVQEALTNTLRHAGARHARVILRYNSDALLLEIIDDGTASLATNGSGGQGLIGMQERAALFGGEVKAGPAGEGGFRVAARLPLGLAEP
jgi:signal transduction histidine kinase